MSTARFDVCGLGSAMVDVMYQTTQAQFEKVGYAVESYGIVDDAEYGRVTTLLKDCPKELRNGGSVANSLVALSQLGSRAAFVCITGDDVIGQHFRSECAELGVTLGVTTIPTSATASVLVLITPDGRRTMRLYPGASPRLRGEHVRSDVIAASKWLFVEGYLFLLGPDAHAAIHRAIAEAKKAGVKVALTASDKMVIDNFREPIEKVLPSIDLLFCNEVEGPTLTGTKEPKEAFEALRKRFPSVVVTAGPEGAFVSHEGVVQHVPTTPCSPVDLTGAGDMFAGAFFHGIASGVPAPRAAHGANALAREVIMQVGPRLAEGAPRFWSQAMSSSPSASKGAPTAAL